MSKDHIIPVLKFILEKEERFFGPGVAELMIKIQHLGSIQAACKEMHMSYTKAWKILKRAEKELGFSILNTSNGGTNGGKSELTPQGLHFLTAYCQMEEELKTQGKELFFKYFSWLHESTL